MHSGKRNRAERESNLRKRDPRGTCQRNLTPPGISTAPIRFTIDAYPISREAAPILVTIIVFSIFLFSPGMRDTSPPRDRKMTLHKIRFMDLKHLIVLRKIESVNQKRSFPIQYSRSIIRSIREAFRDRRSTRAFCLLTSASCRARRSCLP